MIATKQPTPLDLWRRRLGGNQRPVSSLRRLAAMGYMVDGAAADRLVEVGKLTLIILYPDQVRPGHLALRLAGFSGAPVPWGVRWGGAGQCRFCKDLLLQPVPGGPGLRLDVTQTRVLRIGLTLERELDRYRRYPRLPLRQRVQLPKLWAAFPQAEAAALTGDGPELASYARQQRRSARELFAAVRRTRGDLVLHPLPWVSHHWQQAVAVFADLERFPRRQVFAVRRAPGDLVGFHGATEFDFQSVAYRAAKRRANDSTKPAFAQV